MPKLRKNVVKETTDNILAEIARMQVIKNWDNYHLADMLIVGGNKLSKVYRFKQKPENAKLEFLIILLDTLGLKIEIKEKFPRKISESEQ